VFAISRAALLPVTASYWVKEKYRIRSALLFSGIVLLIVGYAVQLGATFLE